MACGGCGKTKRALQTLKRARTERVRLRRSNVTPIVQSETESVEQSKPQYKRG